jgi:prolyl-tRNA editing enzyme YbaK/EbsC (Cys-tRNA(Pro) deacylase)
MWPEPVERIASFLHDSEAIGRLEELPPGSDTPPGPAARAEAFECDGRTLVVLVPADRAIDEERVMRRGGCNSLRPGAARAFPFQGTLVLVDRTVLAQRTVWLEAGSPRHVLGLPPSQLLRLTRAETGSFAVQD